MSDETNRAKDPALFMAARLNLYERLAECGDVEEHAQLCDELEISVDDTEGVGPSAVITPLLNDALEFGLFRDVANPERTILQVVVTTGGPHVEWTRQSGDGASIVVTAYWGSHRWFEVVTLPTVTQLLDELAEQYR